MDKKTGREKQVANEGGSERGLDVRSPAAEGTRKGEWRLIEQ